MDELTKCLMDDSDGFDLAAIVALVQGGNPQEPEWQTKPQGIQLRQSLEISLRTTLKFERGQVERDAVCPFPLPHEPYEPRGVIYEHPERLIYSEQLRAVMANCRQSIVCPDCGSGCGWPVAWPFMCDPPNGWAPSMPNNCSGSWHPRYGDGTPLPRQMTRGEWDSLQDLRKHHFTREEVAAWLERRGFPSVYSWRKDAQNDAAPAAPVAPAPPPDAGAGAGGEAEAEAAPGLVDINMSVHQEQSDVPPADAQNSGEDHVRLVRPPQAFKAQEAEVLKAIRAQGHEPNQLPPLTPGKRWVKSAVWRAIGVCPLFASEKVFNKAWDRLRATKEISERPGL